MYVEKWRYVSMCCVVDYSVVRILGESMDVIMDHLMTDGRCVV